MKQQKQERKKINKYAMQHSFVVFVGVCRRKWTALVTLKYVSKNKNNNNKKKQKHTTFQLHKVKITTTKIK